MAYETLNDFTDWCFNRFVEHNREGKYTVAGIYHDMLKKHFEWNLKGRRLTTQRQRAKNRLHDIMNAMKAGKLDKLTYTGEEGKKEFNDVIAAYEKQLRDFGYPEETINELIILKKENYGH